MRRTKDEAAVTRSALLKAALTVFSRKGYAAATLEDIAKAAGVTRGADLVQQAVAEGGSLLDILRRIFVRQCALIEEDQEARAVMELALFKTGRSPELQAGQRKQLEAGDALIEGIAGAMQQGIAQGVLRRDLDPADMARAFISFENGAIQLWLASPKSFSLKQSAESFAEILISGLQK